MKTKILFLLLFFLFFIIILVLLSVKAKHPPPVGFYPTGNSNSVIPLIGTNTYDWPPMPPMPENK